jgi:ferredoxin
MANLQNRFPENAPGEFFVDSTCIDCDACRQLAPETFEDAGEHSFVYAQPHTTEQWHNALRALLACPTGSIGTEHANKAKELMADFPLHLEDAVYYTGFNSPKSYGGNSYFVRHPTGNWLVDSPKYLSHLVRRFEKLGGLRYIFLTHRDDVAEAHKYGNRFEAQRVIHRDTRPHAGALCAALPGAVPLHRRSSVVESGSAAPERIEDVLLVFVGGASPVDGEAAELLVRVGTAESRPADQAVAKGDAAGVGGASRSHADHGIRRSKLADKNIGATSCIWVSAARHMGSCTFRKITESKRASAITGQVIAADGGAGGGMCIERCTSRRRTRGPGSEENGLTHAVVLNLASPAPPSVARQRR